MVLVGVAPVLVPLRVAPVLVPSFGSNFGFQFWFCLYPIEQIPTSELKIQRESCLI